MLKEMSLKKIFIGAFIVMLLTTFTQKVFFNAGIIKNNSLMTDFISSLVIFFVLGSMAMAAAHVLRNQKTIYLATTYAVGIVLVVIAVFMIAFAYKSNKINNYQEVLTMLEEKQNTEIASLLENKEDFIFLLTSENCPYCVDFLPTIKENVDEAVNIPIYYMNRENDTDSIIKNQMGAATIPFMARIEQGEIVQKYFDNPINFFE